MNTIRCPHCNFLNWEDASACKRCKSDIHGNSVVAQQQDLNPASAFQPTENKSYRPTTAFFSETSGFVSDQVKRVHKNTIITCAILLGIFILAGIFSVRYLASSIFGARDVSKAELLSNTVRPSSFSNYLRVTADSVEDTGGQLVKENTRTHAQTVVYKYAALYFDDKILIARVDPSRNIGQGLDSLVFTGELVEISPDEHSKIFTPMFKDQPELAKVVMPVVLDAQSGYSTWGLVGIAIGLITIVISGGICLGTIKKYGRFSGSGIEKTLAKFGDARTIGANLNSEIQMRHDKVSQVRLLQSWILREELYGIDLQSYSSLVWIYKKTTKHYTNFIPTGKTHELCLHLVDGKTVSISGIGEKQVDQLMQLIFTKTPWIIAGFDDELLSAWNSNFSAFVEAVAARRADYEQSVMVHQTTEVQESVPQAT